MIDLIVDPEYAPKVLEVMASSIPGSWHLTGLEQSSIRSVLVSLAFYRSRCDELQRYQATLPEPYRTEICNILANGRPSPFGGEK